MHKILRAESSSAVSTGPDCQGSPSLSCQVLPKVSLLNDSPLAGARLARFAVGLLLAFAALLASPPAQAQTPLAPTSQAELDDLLVGKRMLLYADSFNFFDFISPGHFNAPQYEGSYSYEQTDPNTGKVTVTLTVDNLGSFTACFIFDSRTAGRMFFPCGDEYPADWRLVDIPVVDLGEPTAPADQAAFHDLVVGKRMVLQDDPHYSFFIDFVSPGRSSTTTVGYWGRVSTAGSYSYEKTGPNTGTVFNNYDLDREEDCTYSITFDSRTTGWLSRLCGDDSPSSSLIWLWRLVDIPSTSGPTESFSITTVAGTGEIGDGAGGFSGDGGPATAAQLNLPQGVAVDGAGNLYIADARNHRIRKVDASGIITTVAGTGEIGGGAGGFSGDGGPATAAQLNLPQGVAVDGAGNLYIADARNHRIRKVDASGIITTVAGTGEIGGGAGGFSGDGGPATAAQLNLPQGVAVDGAGNLYIADARNHRIRKVDASGIITTVAGTGEIGGGAGGFSGDGGPATAAQLNFPQDVAVDGAGNLYIADRLILKVDASGIITTVAAGTGEIGDGVAVDGDSNVYIVDRQAHRILKVDSTGARSTVVVRSFPGGFSGDGGPATAAQLNLPQGVAVDGAGNLYIADTYNHRIRKLTPMTGPVAPGGSESFSISAVTPYSLTVEWMEPENTGSAITDYDVRYREVGSGGDFTDARHEGTARTATLTGLRPGTAYEVQVRATTATGTGAWSELGEVRTSPQQTGDHIYYFPHLAVGASWQTTITYINYSPQEVVCQTDFLSDHGSPLMVSFAGLGTVVSRTDVLPPGGSVHQETNVERSAPLAPGWALANCSGPVKASLLYRQRDSAGTPVAEAGVNATGRPATRFVTFAEQGEGQFGTGVAYANPSATAAHVTFTVRDASGATLASVNRTLLPGGHDAHSMSGLFGFPFSGSLEVTSTEPILSLSINFEANPVFSSLPPGELDASAQGATTYYFPHLAVGASWQTTITYINYSPQEVVCQTDFLSDHGSPLMVSFAGLGTVVSRTDVLPPGGSVHQETNVERSAPLAPGWALANCSGPVKASLLYRQRDSAGTPVAEAGVNATGRPATRFVTFAEQGEGQFGTGVAYANPSATAAHVTFTVRDASGATLASVNRTLLPGGHDAHSMSGLFGFPFSGSLEVTSTEPILSLSINFEADPVFSSLPPGELDASAQ